MKGSLHLPSSIISELRNLLFRCEMWKNCESYAADSWYCIEDGGDHCGKAKKGRVGKRIEKRSKFSVSLEALIEEPQEVVECKTKKEHQ